MLHVSADETVEASWQDYANCLGVDPDLFFPERGASTREAKEVCRGCVVREDCLEYALANGEKFGIWGGMSERERRRIRRQRALARPAPPADPPYRRQALEPARQPGLDRAVVAEVELAPIGRRLDRVEHRPRHQPDQLGPCHGAPARRRASYTVAGPTVVGRDQVHRHLHARRRPARPSARTAGPRSCTRRWPRARSRSGVASHRL